MADSPAPRKRGRPRKNPEAAAPTPAPNASPAPETPAPRKRGRPPKAKPEPVGPVAKRGPGRPRKPVLDAPKPAARRRGRPPKSLTGPRPQPPAAPTAPAPPSLLPANFTTADLNRLRLTELRGALLSELSELEGALPRVFEAIRLEVQAESADVVASLNEAVAGIRAYDEPWALHLSAQIEKLAQRLAVFRALTKPDADDLSTICARLAKAARKLRR